MTASESCAKPEPAQVSPVDYTDTRRIYLAGPMTGYPEFNYPAFRTATAFLRRQGHEVVCPTELHDGDTSRPWDYYVRCAIGGLIRCDTIALLPGWETSRGARLEHTIAEALDMVVLYPGDWHATMVPR